MARFVHGSLAIYLLASPKTRDGSSKLASLTALSREDTSRGVVTLLEAGDLERIHVENASGDDIFIQAGQVLRGGVCDRMVKADTILRAADGRLAPVLLPVFSVECHGDRRPKAEGFNLSPWLAPTLPLKQALRAGDQQEVWNAVAEAESVTCKLMEYGPRSIYRQSLWRMLNFPEVHERFKGPFRQYRLLADAHPKAAGVVFTMAGRIASAELYCSTALFRQTWQRLLFTAQAEAMLSPKRPSGEAASLWENPSNEDVAGWLAAHGAEFEHHHQVCNPPVHRTILGGAFA